MHFCKRFSAALLGAVLLCGIAACDAAQSLDSIPVVIHAKSGAQIVSLEVARTPDQQAMGLMHRTELPRDKGMIFPFDPPRPVAFWMKNTLIPLDILYIAPDNTVGSIVRMAKPRDETPLPSGIVTRAVIELAGGEVDRRGIAVGDRIETDLLIQEPK